MLLYCLINYIVLHCFFILHCIYLSFNYCNFSLGYWVFTDYVDCVLCCILCIVPIQPLAARFLINFPCLLSTQYSILFLCFLLLIEFCFFFYLSRSFRYFLVLVPLSIASVDNLSLCKHPSIIIHSCVYT